jgi:hypothetical protein
VRIGSDSDRMLVAELTDSETRSAEANPYNHIVCSVMGLDCRDPARGQRYVAYMLGYRKTISTASREKSENDILRS